MTKQSGKTMRISVFLSMCIGAEIMMLIDVAVTLFADGMPARYFTAAWLAVTVIVQIIPRFTVRGKTIAASMILAVGGVLFFAGRHCWNSMIDSMAYRVVDDGKGALYADKSVMLIVPHEDDDINVAGGVVEQFVAYGSEVRVVFVTNGDYEGKGERRIHEAVAYCDYIGIPEDHVIFLGYGDQWSEDGPHLYNAEPGVVRQSYIGNTATYGTAEHPAYHDGNAYTVENLIGDMQRVILEYRPDVILCSDFDEHIDHRAVSLTFDKAMGRILCSGAEYEPVVLKGFAYNTAWHAKDDYYALNMRSTRKIYDSPDQPGLRVYRWEDRARLPVSAALLSRSLLTSPFYAGMEIYHSQHVTDQASRIINGDKVFWQRRTDSLCYGADIQTSSGESTLLNDFMLVEDHDLLGNRLVPGDGTWVPDTSDDNPTVAVTFPEKTDIGSIVLYDNPAADQNVLNAQIIFDDGVVLETGPLDPNGAASAIAVEKQGVSAFQILLTKTEGESAGLTEVEAFREPVADDLRFIKLMDEDGNFAYDYCVDESGEEVFLLYISGEMSEFTPENYAVSCDNRKIQARIEDGKLIVSCLKGEEGTVTVANAAGDCRDSVYIRNPGTLWRMWTEKWQEQREEFPHSLQNLVACRVWNKMEGILGADA